MITREQLVKYAEQAGFDVDPEMNSCGLSGNSAIDELVYINNEYALGESLMKFAELVLAGARE